MDKMVAVTINMYQSDYVAFEEHGGFQKQMDRAILQRVMHLKSIDQQRAKIQSEEEKIAAAEGMRALRASRGSTKQKAADS